LEEAKKDVLLRIKIQELGGGGIYTIERKILNFYVNKLLVLGI